MTEYKAMQSLPHHRLKGFGYILIIATIFLFILYYNETNFNMNFIGSYEEYYKLSINRSNYLVYGDNCVIPNIPAFSADVKKFYKSSKYYNCSKHELLTYISKTNGTVQLMINENLIKSYASTSNVTCCYSYIRRKSNDKDPDNNLSYTKCKEFYKNVTLNETMVLVKCKKRKNGKEIYKNTHAFATFEQVEAKINFAKKSVQNDSDNDHADDNVEPIKILFIGIDSVSRLNLRRAMPKTQKYFQDNKWIEYQGYNKIGDNTYPNLMGIFTGSNNTRIYKDCDPKVIGNIDKCNLIWYDFNKNNFITAYAEDTTHISTFNYKKKGFTKEPTDFYYRPYMMASEKISIVNKYGMIYCAGPEPSGERILNLIKDFSITFQNYSTFGIFWMNSFSHNDNNNPSMMDTKVLQFLKYIDHNGILNTTIVIFLSDHGLRFGDFRYTKTGWYEERLPFLQFWIPEWFRNRYPEKYENLKSNYDKLTTPYDLHMTLQELLHMSNKSYEIIQSSGCYKCHSLFELVSNTRSCEDVSIDQHYCTCTNYHPIDKNDKLTINSVDYILDELNNKLNKSADAKICATYRLKDILSSSVSKMRETFNKIYVKYILLVISTIPEAVFEATINIKYNKDNTTTFNLSGDISRLDSYALHSKCVEDYNLKKYCYCTKTTNV